MVRRLTSLLILICYGSKGENLIQSTDGCFFRSINRDAMILQQLTSDVQILCGILPGLYPINQRRDKKFPKFFKRVHGIS